MKTQTMESQSKTCLKFYCFTKLYKQQTQSYLLECVSLKKYENCLEKLNEEKCN